MPVFLLHFPPARGALPGAPSFAASAPAGIDTLEFLHYNGLVLTR